MRTRRRSTDSPKMHTVAGYRVLLQHIPNAIINVECAVNAGFISETKATTGINHLLEHVLTDGWKKCGTTCSGYWADKGVDMNASTDSTILRYHTKGTLTYLQQMVQYIANIATDPVLRVEDLKKEKEAVIDELSTYGGEPESNLDQVFNHHFYTGGLVYKDDWKLQIKNLAAFDLKTIKKAYLENYNPKNLLFIVTGKFDTATVLELFRRELHHRPAGELHLPTKPCFTLDHGIYHSKYDSPTTTIVVGFPSKVKAHDKSSIHLNTLCGVLNDVLFAKLRTELTLVYGVHFYYHLNVCGTSLTCEVNVREQNVLACLKALFATLNHYTKALFPAKTLFASRERELFNFKSKLPYTRDYLLQFIHQIDEPNPIIHSNAEKVRIVQHVMPLHLKQLFQRVYDPSACMLVYQGKKDLKLAWADFL